AGDAQLVVFDVRRLPGKEKGQRPRHEARHDGHRQGRWPSATPSQITKRATPHPSIVTCLNGAPPSDAQRMTDTISARKPNWPHHLRGVACDHEQVLVILADWTVPLDSARAKPRRWTAWA